MLEHSYLVFIQDERALLYYNRAAQVVVGWFFLTRRCCRRRQVKTDLLQEFVQWLNQIGLNVQFVVRHVGWERQLAIA